MRCCIIPTVAAIQLQKLMADHGVVCSMSRSGNVWDNAVMESFFSSFKTGSDHVLIGSLQTPRVSVSETRSPCLLPRLLA
jgi:transposase InsO family protein